MPQIYKVCVLNQSNNDANEVFAIKPYLESFDSFKDEIFIRMPELKNQSFRIYYEDEDGDKITIFNALDFGIFQEQKIKKVFIVKNGTPKSVQFQEKPNVASDASRTSSASHARVLHPNVICDSCDKSIFGYRYKCLECADFDLCMECEPKTHNQHLMIRICDPNDAEICYRSKLGKRFLRHRRSESLCMKSDEKEREKEKRHHHGHKRHASSASGVRPPVVGDVLCSFLKSFAAGPYQASAANNKPSTSDGTENQSAKVGADAATNTANAGGESHSQQKAASSSNTNGTQTPTNPPAYGFNFLNPNEKPPCVPLKHGIDMLSHVAQNFAAMMDPFATFMEQNADAYASATTPTAPTATTPTAPAAATSPTTESTTATAVKSAAAAVVKTAAAAAKTAAEVAATAAANVAANTNKNTEDTEPLIGIEDIEEDDDEEDLRNMVTSMNMSRESSREPVSDANQKDERSGSIDADKGSPSREWTFIDPNEIAESAGAVGSNGGAIPKQITPPPTAQADETNNKVDYAELSRLLSTHIVAQNQTKPSTSIQNGAQAQTDAADDKAKSAKTPPPTPMHPDARVNESLNAMMAMGFSNEGGWLTQLLETVDGSISNALDLLQPHK